MQLINAYGSPVWFEVYDGNKPLITSTWATISHGKDSQFNSGVPKPTIVVRDKQGGTQLAMADVWNNVTVWITKTPPVAFIGGLNEEIRRMLALEVAAPPPPFTSTGTGTSGSGTGVVSLPPHLDIVIPPSNRTSTVPPKEDIGVVATTAANLNNYVQRASSVAALANLSRPATPLADVAGEPTDLGNVLLVEFTVEWPPLSDPPMVSGTALDELDGSSAPEATEVLNTEGWFQRSAAALLQQVLEGEALKDEERARRAVIDDVPRNQFEAELGTKLDPTGEFRTALQGLALDRQKR